MALNKSLYKGKRELTMEQFQNLDVIDENTDYNIMDYPDNGMTNAQLVKTLDYNRLFKVGHITICLDDGVFRKGHILQLQVVDNVRIWKDITATSALDIEDLAKLGGLPLGAIIPIAMVTNDPYVQPLDGRNLSQTGIYADFCTWLKNRINEDVNNVPTCTIVEYATEMATYGQCGKFVINDSDVDISENLYVVKANSIKLPTITEFIASNNGGDAIGLAELDEFKSHAHGTMMSYTSAQSGNAIGVSWINYSGGEASTYSAGGEETRPKNIRYPYYIVVATGIKTNVQIDLENVANDINSINSTLSKTEQVEVIYDMDGGNLLDWEYTGGITNGSSVSGKDFSKYKRLRCYLKCGSQFPVVEVDLTVPSRILSGGNYNGTDNSYYVESLGQLLVSINVSLDKTTIRVDTKYSSQSTSDYFIYKIEGVL